MSWPEAEVFAFGTARVCWWEMPIEPEAVACLVIFGWIGMPEFDMYWEPDRFISATVFGFARLPEPEILVESDLPPPESYPVAFPFKII